MRHRRYRKDDGTELQRDFTYVSDIVEGVIAASELGAPLEVFNLGNTRPEKVSTLIHLLEQGLGVKANITQAPISAGDVPMTFADVSHARLVPLRCDSNRGFFVVPELLLHLRLRLKPRLFHLARPR